MVRSHLDFVDQARGSQRGHQTPFALDHREELSVDAAFCARDGLGLLPSGRISTKLMLLKVRTIDKTQAARAPARKQAKDFLPQTPRTSAAIGCRATSNCLNREANPATDNALNIASIISQSSLGGRPRQCLS